MTFFLSEPSFSKRYMINSFIWVVNSRAALLVILLFDVVSNINITCDLLSGGSDLSMRAVKPIYFMRIKIKLVYGGDKAPPSDSKFETRAQPLQLHPRDEHRGVKFQNIVKQATDLSFLMNYYNETQIFKLINARY